MINLIDFKKTNITFTGRKAKPVVAFKQDDETITEYKSGLEASKELGISNAIVYQVVSGLRKSASGYIFVNPKDYKKDDSTFDIDKLRRKSEEAMVYGNSKPVYVVYKSGEVKKFGSIKEAANALNISYSAILDLLNLKTKATDNIRVVQATAIEKNNEKDEIVIDSEKLDEILKKRYTPRNQVAIYAINQDGTYKKYSSITKYASESGVSKQAAHQALKLHHHICNESVIVAASELESQDENGNIIVDCEKIKNIVNVAFETLSSKKPVYAIEQNGSYKRYPSITDAAKAIGINVSVALKNVGTMVFSSSNVMLIYASDVEHRDETGHVQFDKEKFESIILKAKPVGARAPLYVLYPNGSFRRFDSIQSASLELNIPYSKIENYISGKNCQPLTYKFVRASMVESMTRDGMVVDLNKIKKIYHDCQLSALYKQIYVISKDGTCEKYDSAACINAMLGYTQSSISKILKGKSKITGNVTFARAIDVESLDIDGNYSLDENKLKKIIQDRFVPSHGSFHHLFTD